MPLLGVSWSHGDAKRGTVKEETPKSLILPLRLEARLCHVLLVFSRPTIFHVSYVYCAQEEIYTLSRLRTGMGELAKSTYAGGITSGESVESCRRFGLLRRLSPDSALPGAS